MRGLFLFAAFLAAATYADDGTRRPVPAVKIASPPTIDGDISDEVWKGVPAHTGFIDPNTGTAVSEQTTVRVAYDAKNLYFAFEMSDAKPDEILGRETQEDSRYSGMNFNTEDCVDVRLDPFNVGLGRDQTWFSVNAIGTRSAMFGGGRGKKTEWKGAWQAFSKRTATGWTAEMSIPWAMLNYPAKSGPQTMGINFSRYHSRVKLLSYFSNLGPNELEERQGVWVGVEAPAPPKPKVSFLPYVLPGFDDKNRFTFRSGVDARFPITPELTAVASLNPDFGTIEGAVESVGFTRTERSVAERRPFFLEGAGFFRSGDVFQLGQLFYPRRIDRFDLGTKVYGNLTPKDSIGLLQTVTFGDRLDLVGKYKHQRTPREAIEVFANIKDAVNDKANLTAVSYGNEWNKLGTAAKLGVSNDNGKTAFSNFYNVYYQDKHNLTYLYYTDINEDFRVPDGLQGFTGIRGWSIYENVMYKWRGGPLREMNIEAYADMTSLSDGTPFNRGAGFNGFFALNHSDVALRVNYSDYFYDRLEDNFATVGFTKGWDNRFANYGLDVGFGKLSNEKATTLSPRFSYRLAPGFDFSYSGFFQNFLGHTKQNILTASYELSPTQQFGTRLVERDGDVNWYLSYRDSGKKGLEWFAIIGDPNARKFRRMVQFKFVVPI